MLVPRRAEVDILSSITSTSIQKISLVFQGRWCDIDWETLDESLYRVACRSGCAQKLEVDIGVVSLVPEAGGGTGLVGIADFLRRFKEKGHIRVIRVGPGWREIVYPPPPVE